MYEQNIEIWKAKGDYDEKKRRRNIQAAATGGALIGTSPMWGSAAREAADMVDEYRYLNRSRAYKPPKISPWKVGRGTSIGVAGLGAGVAAAGIASDVRHHKRDPKRFDRVSRKVQRESWLYRALNDKKKRG